MLTDVYLLHDKDVTSLPCVWTDVCMLCDKDVTSLPSVLTDVWALQDKDATSLPCVLTDVWALQDKDVTASLCVLTDVWALLDIKMWLNCRACWQVAECCNDTPEAPCCSGQYNVSEGAKCPCDTCLAKMQPVIYNAFSATGGVGLFFSLTEVEMSGFVVVVIALDIF